MRRRRERVLLSGRQGAHPPTSGAGYQDMLNRVPTAIWSGADGGFTTPAPNGQRTWWFGDTVSVNGWLHSSTLIQRDGAFYPSVETVIPNDGEIVYWPAHGALLPDGRLLVPCGGLTPTESWFENQPMRAAYVTVNDDGTVEFDGWLPYWPEGMDGGNAAQRYDSVVLDGGTLHAFARPAETVDGFVRGVMHRSVPLASVTDPGAWSSPTLVVPYETDGSWSPWIDADGYWRAVSMSPDTRTIRVYGAESGDGPWALTGTHPSPWTPDGTPGEFFYVLHAHPWAQLWDDDERLLLSVSHTTDSGADPHAYRPRFSSIPTPSGAP